MFQQASTRCLRCLKRLQPRYCHNYTVRYHSIKVTDSKKLSSNVAQTTTESTNKTNPDNANTFNATVQSDTTTTDTNSNIDISSLHDILAKSLSDTEKQQFTPTKDTVIDKFKNWCTKLIEYKDNKHNAFPYILLGKLYLTHINPTYDSFLLKLYLNEFPILHTTGYSAYSNSQYVSGLRNYIARVWYRRLAPSMLGYKPTELLAGVQYAYNQFVGRLNSGDVRLNDSIASERVQRSFTQTQLLKQLYDMNLTLNSTIESCTLKDVYRFRASNRIAAGSAIQSLYNSIDNTIELPCVSTYHVIHTIADVAKKATNKDITDINDIANTLFQQFDKVVGQYSGVEPVKIITEHVDATSATFDIEHKPSTVQYKDNQYYYYVEYEFDTNDVWSYTVNDKLYTYNTTNNFTLRFSTLCTPMIDGIHYVIRQSINQGETKDDILDRLQRPSETSIFSVVYLYNQFAGETHTAESIYNNALQSTSVQWKLEDIINSNSIDFSDAMSRLQQVIPELTSQRNDTQQ